MAVREIQGAQKEKQQRPEDREGINSRFQKISLGWFFYVGIGWVRDIKILPTDIFTWLA